MLCEAFELPICRWSSYQFIFNKKLIKKGELTWLNKGCDDLQYQSVKFRRKAQKMSALKEHYIIYLYSNSS